MERDDYNVNQIIEREERNDNSDKEMMDGRQGSNL